MSERAPSHHESLHPKHTPERHAEHHEAARPRHEREHKAEKHAPVHELERKAHHEAQAAREMLPAAQETPREHTTYISRELKKETFNRTMVRVRKKLSAPARTFSKIIHQPVVDSISQVGSQTVARPSGLLGGSIVAFLGSSTFLWMARHYGFTYNYLLFAILFVAGFAIGMILELIIFVLRRKHA